MSDYGRQAAPEREEMFQVEVVAIPDDDDATAEHKEWLKEMRAWLIVLATLAASVTYQAGLNPPGGFWQDSGGGHIAGMPVLYSQLPSRYLVFYYFNSTAFVTSLAIIILILNERFYQSENKVAALAVTTMVDLLSLVVAYIAGSSHDVRTTVGPVALICFLFACVIYSARVLPNLCFALLFVLGNKGLWLPVTENMRKRVQAAKERERKEVEKQKDKPMPLPRRGDVKHGLLSCKFCPCVRAFDYDLD